MMTLVVEDGKRRLQLWRPARQADHRALLRIFDKRPITVVERQGCRGCKRPNGGEAIPALTAAMAAPECLMKVRLSIIAFLPFRLLAARSASKSGRKFAQQPLPYIPTFVQG